MHPVSATASMPFAAPRGRMRVAGLNINNRNNASQPRAGD